MGKLRLAVLGSGGIANLHLSILARRLDEVELVSVVDVREEAARKAQEEYGFQRCFTDYREGLGSDVDAVLVCVPTFLHAEMATAAIRAGKPVFCQKPMARTLDQAEVMTRAVEETGVPLQMGFVRRFDEEWLAWREAVQSGRIGRPVIWHDVSSGSGPSAPWYNQEEQGGGPFLDGCIHNFDFALFTFGPAEWAFAHARTFGLGHTALDTGTATVRFASGDELMLAWSWGLPTGCSGARVFELIGPEGTITWPREKPEDLEKRSFVVHRVGDQREPVEFPRRALNTAFEAEMDEFLAVARGERRPRAGWKEGLEALRLALAVLESGRSGQPVLIRQ